MLYFLASRPNFIPIKVTVLFCPCPSSLNSLGENTRDDINAVESSPHGLTSIWTHPRQETSRKSPIDQDTKDTS